MTPSHPTSRSATHSKSSSGAKTPSGSPSVLSTFGHMFPPRHQRAANEMTRVCREGGAIVTAAWTPEGTVGATTRAGAAYMPPPPDYASPPFLWGSEEHVRETFGPSAKGF